MLAPSLAFQRSEALRRAKKTAMSLYLGLAVVAAVGFVIGRFSNVRFGGFIRRMHPAE